jgi:hypothetical protein
MSSSSPPPAHWCPTDRLRGRVGLADSTLQRLWLVAFVSTAIATATGSPDDRPRPVPVLGESERLNLTDAWLRNEHRATAPSVGAYR